MLATPLVVSTGFIGCSRAPNAEQIKADLIGERMGNWTFASPSEILELNINSQKKQGQLIEYEISMKLQDI